MPLFASRRSKNSKPKSFGSDGSNGKKPSPDVFSRYGGRLTGQQFRKRMRRIRMQPRHKKEYVERVMERFDTAPHSRGITRQEFEKGLDEMAKNTRDPIDRENVERLRKHFK